MDAFAKITYKVRERLGIGMEKGHSTADSPAPVKFGSMIVQRSEQHLRQTMRRNQTLKPMAHWVVGKRYQASLEIVELRKKLGKKIAGSGSFQVESSIDPAKMIWVFGMGRSGNTWMLGMMRDISDQQTWDEPLVGKLFGEFYSKETAVNLARANFIMGDPIRKGWINSIRHFVLAGARYSHPGLGPEDYLVIGEHNGSVGAPLIMESLPESSMILLVRDPRDVISSILDGAKAGGWIHTWKDDNGMWEHNILAQEGADAYVTRLAERYLLEVGGAKRAYDLHKGRKVLVKYEDLRANTLSTMRFIYSSLEIPVDGEEIERAVAAHSWENLSEKNKGAGKFNRKASPGGWRVDLTPQQARIVEGKTAPLLEEFYPA